MKNFFKYFSVVSFLFLLCSPVCFSQIANDTDTYSEKAQKERAAQKTGFEKQGQQWGSGLDKVAGQARGVQEVKGTALKGVEGAHSLNEALDLRSLNGKSYKAGFKTGKQITLTRNSTTYDIPGGKYSYDIFFQASGDVLFVNIEPALQAATKAQNPPVTLRVFTNKEGGLSVDITTISIQEDSKGRKKGRVVKIASLS